LTAVARHRGHLRWEIWLRSYVALGCVVFLTLLLMAFDDWSPLLSSDFPSYLALFTPLMAATLVRRGQTLRRLLSRLPCDPAEELKARLEVGFACALPMILLLLAFTNRLPSTREHGVLFLIVLFLSTLGLSICIFTAHSNKLIAFAEHFLVIAFVLAAMWLLETVHWQLLFAALVAVYYFVTCWKLRHPHSEVRLHHCLWWFVLYSYPLILLLYISSWRRLEELVFPTLFVCYYLLPSGFSFFAKLRATFHGQRIPEKQSMLFGDPLLIAAPRQPLSPWEKTHEVLSALSLAILNAFLLVCLSTLFFPVEPSKASLPVDPVDIRTLFQALTLALILFIPLALGFFASDLSAGWRRQRALLERLPPRIHLVLKMRFREFFIKIIPIFVFAVFVALLHDGFRGPKDTPIVPLALVFLGSNILGSALLTYLLDLRELWTRMLCVLAVYGGSFSLALSLAR
jgi:hypothetical protein